MREELESFSSRELFEHLQVREFDFLDYINDQDFEEEAMLRGYILVPAPVNLSIVLEESLKNILKAFKNIDIETINKIDQLINKN
jgi:hypothetical protein